MKLLLDIGENQYRDLPPESLPFVAGQLLTPLTRYKRWAEVFAIDNGGYTNFDPEAFQALLEREKDHAKKCLYVSMPDVPGSARRTIEIFTSRNFYWVRRDWPLAYVCQDGSEDHVIPWDAIAAVFIGGTTEWKMSKHVAEILKTATILGKHKHVGRINSKRRWNHFEKLGADTCDGSGVSRFHDRLLETIAGDDHPLLAVGGD